MKIGLNLGANLIPYIFLHAWTFTLLFNTNLNNFKSKDLCLREKLGFKNTFIHSLLEVLKLSVTWGRGVKKVSNINWKALTRWRRCESRRWSWRGTTCTRPTRTRTALPASDPPSRGHDGWRKECIPGSGGCLQRPYL